MDGPQSENGSSGSGPRTEVITFDEGRSPGDAVCGSSTAFGSSSRAFSKQRQ
jgi:hypothetical protein